MPDPILSRMPIRVRRGGVPLSVFPADLDFVTDEDLEELPAAVAIALLRALNAAEDWNYWFSLSMWVRRTGRGGNSFQRVAPKSDVA